MSYLRIPGQAYPILVGSGAPAQFSLQYQLGAYSRLLVVADTHTAQFCYPRVSGMLPTHSLCTIPAGEPNKNLDTLSMVWQALTEAAFDRQGALLALGGGMVGDLCGFAAGTYKRGIAFFQMPTTLLAMVDASVGAKTGIDYFGLKNHLGLFYEPRGVYMDVGFLDTLPPVETLSGFAEIVKHCLIRDEQAWLRLSAGGFPPSGGMEALISHSLQIKSDIVAQDPLESGLRKGLNFGHTLGHAIETFLLTQRNPVPHGYAVAAGMRMEAFLSRAMNRISEDDLARVDGFLRRIFGSLYPNLQPEDLPAVVALLQQDKKAEDGAAKFVLLRGIGDFTWNESVPQELIAQAWAAYFHPALTP